MHAYASPVPEATALREAIARAVPTLRTERLILRAPRAEDFDRLEAIWRSDRGRYIGGPFNAEDAWLDYAQCAAGWVLRGVGYWTVTRGETGQVLGLVGLGQEVWDPEMELGWLMCADAEGRGYAFEAAQAARAWGFDTLGLKTCVSIVNHENTRSIALAERMGARVDATVLPADLAATEFAYRHLPGGRAQ